MSRISGVGGGGGTYLGKYLDEHTKEAVVGVVTEFVWCDQTDTT